MAEQIPYCIAENLLMKLGSSVFHEIGLIYGVGGELRKLENTLSTVRAVLLDAEEQQERSHAVAVWIRRLKDVVYDADDFLDDFATEELRRKTDDRGRIAGHVSDCFPSTNHFAFRFKMGHRIKAIRKRLDDIANDISKFNFVPKVISDVQVRNRGRETCSVVEKSHKIVGRDENRKEIIELLIQSSTSQENLSMVVIAGMGGLGKTTLAQLVYNDQWVLNYFDLNMWICVSNDFDVEVLIKNILRSATNEDVGNLPLEQLRKRLQEKLDRKRYLLVLDDVWNEDAKKWGRFITLLPVGENGSKILVTTRSTRVASVIGVDSPYVVKGLKEDESWDLFQSLAFKKNETMHPNLVAIGKEIVKMCKGVPLVLETLGRILYFKTQESQWLNIKNNKSLMLLGDESDILPVLRLSYDNLPTHLKQCFAYCAVFPKDHRIEKKLLVQLWMAQGYLQACNENIDLEDVGNQYFEDLLSRSLFQKVENENENVNNILSCKVHDLIHDLAQSIVKSEFIIITDDVKIVPERIHHVSLFNKPNEMLKDLMGKPIRTFFMNSYHNNHYSRNRLIASLKCSRVMKVNFPLHEVPTSLIKLSHLRYLDLSHSYFEDLPAAITRLKHLQTLKLLFCRNFKEWPRNMKKLINLRHLEIDGNNELTYMPRGLGELTKLQTLPLFLVGNDSRHKIMGRLSELKFLNNLRGQLEIEGLSNARASEAKEANLEGKQYLECLVLSYRLLKEATQESEEAVSVMESLQPHSNLKELFIHDYKGARFPNWMMNDGLDLLLPNLVTIHMCFCYRSQALPPFGQLPSLKCLRLFYLYAVKYMKDYSSSAKPFFPSLKTLVIVDLPNLEGWGRRDVAAEQAPSYPYLEDLRLENTTLELGLHLISISSSLKSLTIRDCSGLATLPNWIGRLTSLTQLSIEDCPDLTSLPEEMQSLRDLRALEISGCPFLSRRCRKEIGEDWPKISHIPKIMIR